MVKTILGLTIAIAAIAAALCFDMPVSRASFGDAPWCIMRYGDDVYWDCQYRTSQECLAALASGNRGSCNVNPSAGSSTPAAVAQPKHQKQHEQQQ